MTSTLNILAAGLDIAEDHFEIEIESWGARGLAPIRHSRLPDSKVCLSCGAIQPYLGTLPCDH